MTTLPAVRTIDSYLSRKAALTWPRAIVYKEPDGSFTLERVGEPPVGLGEHFGKAREALVQLRKREQG